MRLRVRYAKLGKLRFLGQRDAARAWERAVRRIELPVATSRGFTPRPRISFGLALPTGAESTAEYVDIELDRVVELDGIHDRLSDALPIGFTVTAVAELADGATSLQEDVVAVTWEIWHDGIGADRVAEAAARLLAASELPLSRVRKGERRTDDVRPLILSLAPGATDGARENLLVAELATVGRGLRPAELATLAFPDVDPLDVRVLRTHQWIEHDGTRREVVSLPTVVEAPKVGA